MNNENLRSSIGNQPNPGEQSNIVDTSKVFNIQIPDTDENGFAPRDGDNNYPAGDVKLVMPSSTGGGISGSGYKAVKTIIDVARPIAGAAMESPEAKAMAQKLGQTVVTGIQTVFGGQKQVPNGTSDSSKPPGGGGGGKGNYWNSDLPMSSKGYVVSQSRNPVVVKLDTKIVPPIFNPLFNQGNSRHSSLFLNSQMLHLPTANSGVTTYWENILSVALQNKMQESVNFNVSLVDMSLSRMTDYFNLILEALQFYYFINSILQYTGNSENKNDGMSYLRTLITVEVFNAYSNLEKILQGLPIPYNFVIFTYWLGSVYSSSALPNSTVCKIIPMNPAVMTSTQITNEIEAIITSLADSDMRSTSSLLGRCVPTWISTTSSLPPTLIKPLYDTNFSTLWANLTYKFRDSFNNIHIAGPLPMSDDNMLYYIAENDLDGAVFALFDWYDGITGNLVVSGMLENVYSATGYGNSRYNYESGQGLVPVIRNGSMLHRALHRGDSHIPVYKDTTIEFVAHNPFGTIVTQEVNSYIVGEATKKFLDWLFDINSIVNLKTPAQRGQGSKNVKK